MLQAVQIFRMNLKLEHYTFVYTKSDAYVSENILGVSLSLIFTDIWLNHETYSGEFKLRPSVVRSIPGAKATILESCSAALMKDNRPTIPNWSMTIPFGMFDIVPEIKFKTFQIIW